MRERGFPLGGQGRRGWDSRSFPACVFFVRPDRRLLWGRKKAEGLRADDSVEIPLMVEDISGEKSWFSPTSEVCVWVGFCPVQRRDS